MIIGLRRTARHLEANEGRMSVGGSCEFGVEVRGGCLDNGDWTFAG